MVFVRKEDLAVRFCVDYRKLNHKTVFDAFPGPHPGEAPENFSVADPDRGICHV